MLLKRISVLAAFASFLIGAAASAQDMPSKKVASVPGAINKLPTTTKTSPPSPRRIDTFGTTNISYYRIPASEFTPLSSTADMPYSDFWYDQPGDIFGRYSTVANGYYIASPHLPSGATIEYFELDGCNTNGGTSTVDAYLYDCDYHGDCTATTPIQVSIAAGVGCTNANDNTMVFQVDNFIKSQVVRVVTRAGDNTTTFSGVIIGYYLNVSPAPGSPTFGDVPLSDPGFQYIEALVASGITAGCGGGNYCPDSPLTRRQMAVFLAKAFGLQWN